jgi:hypothetical protein
MRADPAVAGLTRRCYRQARIRVGASADIVTLSPLVTATAVRAVEQGISASSITAAATPSPG